MSERFGRASTRGVLLAAALLAMLAPAASAAPPANDDFSAAAELSGTTATASGTTAEATKETAEPNHHGSYGGRSVWYRWTAPHDGVAVVDTSGSSFDTVLAVYTGTSVGGLHAIASNDDAIGTQSRVELQVTEGQEYRIAIDGYGSSFGAFVLNVAASIPPANDDLADAAPLTGSSATAAATNVNATAEAGEPYHHNYSYGRSSVWWTWTAPSTGGATVSADGEAAHVAAVYTGTSVSGLVPVASDEYGNLRFRAVAGTTYKIAVDSRYYESESAFTLTLSLANPPDNDDFAAAASLGSAPTALATGTNVGASSEPGEPTDQYWYGSSRATVWYSWTAPSDGSLTLRADAAFNRTLAVYTGTQVSELTRVPNQAQNYHGGPEQIRVRVDAGTTYMVQLDGIYGEAGTFNLSLDLVARPANDDFVDAETLTGTSDDAVGTNVGATQEPGEPIHEENYYDPSVWYQWTAPSDGGVTVDTTGSGFDSVVAVYTGATVSTLTRVVSTRVGWTGPEKRYFRAAAGVTYKIAVDGRNAQTGAFQLSLDEIPPPENDMFADAQGVAASDVDTVAGNTLGATGEHGEPGEGGTAGASVWYRWTASQAGRATAELTEADFAAGIRAYTGESVGALEPVGTSGYRSVRWRTTPGTTYYVVVDGGSRPNRGFFSLRLRHQRPPANDRFEAATALSGEDVHAEGTDVAATRQEGEPTHCCGSGASSVWWTWTAPADGQVSVAVENAYFDWVAAVYTGDALGALTAVRWTDDRAMTFPVTEGTTYRIAVDSYYSSDWYSYYETEGGFDLRLELLDAPGNDDFANATVLEGSKDDVDGRTIMASSQPGEPGHAGAPAEHSVWYRWRAPATGQATFSTADGASSTRMAAYLGSHVDALTPMAQSDGAGSMGLWAVRGEVYRIAVDTLPYGSPGRFHLSLRHGTPPENDDFTWAEHVPGATAQLDRTTAFATSEPGERDHAGNDGGASIWFTWAAPSDGTLTVSTAGSAIDTLLGVYTGGMVDVLTQVGANDDDPVAGDGSSSLTIPVSAGNLYAIAIDGKNDRHGPVQGAVHLSLAHTAAAAAPQQRTAGPAVVDGTKTAIPTAPQGWSGGPLTVSASVPSQRIADVVSRGLAGTASCSPACRLEVSVTLPRKGRPKARGAAKVATRALAGKAGESTAFVLKLTPAARRLLRRTKSVTVRVTVAAQFLEQKATATRRVTLRR